MDQEAYCFSCDFASATHSIRVCWLRHRPGNLGRINERVFAQQSEAAA